MTKTITTSSFGLHASVAGPAASALTYELVNAAERANAAGAAMGIKAFPCADAGPAQAATPHTFMPHTFMIPSRPWHAAPPRDLTRL